MNCQGVWAAPVLDSAPGGFNPPTPNKFYLYSYFLSSPQPPPPPPPLPAAAAADRHSGLGGQQGKIATLFQTPGRLAPPFSYTSPGFIIASPGSRSQVHSLYAVLLVCMLRVGQTRCSTNTSNGFSSHYINNRIGGPPPRISRDLTFHSELQIHKLIVQYSFH